jgi:CheY-like chemotaxis protein
MAGGMAHQLNNLIGIIQGSFEKLQATLPAGHTGLKYIDYGNQATLRATRLISDVLSLQWVDSSERCTLELNEEISAVLREMKHVIPAAVTITLQQISNSTPVSINSARARELIRALLSNAVLASPGKPHTITISLEQLSDSESALTIQDTGCGMQPEVIRQAFEPFFSTRKNEGAPGLGLTVARGIVRSHGGSIELQSTPDEGTRVRVVLPVISAVNSAPSQLEGPDSQDNKKTVLIVDDDEELLVEMYRETLEEDGFSVLSADNGITALKIFNSYRDQIGLVLTDQLMPGMSGEELASKILQQRHDLPIILTTGYSDILSEQQVMQRGFKKYVIKPIALNALPALVREFFDGS